MKQWLIPAIVLVAVAGTGLGVGWSINEWRDDEGAGKREAVPTPTANPVRITATEAEVIAADWAYDWLQEQVPVIIDRFQCEKEDFNSVTNRWIVRCQMCSRSDENDCGDPIILGVDATTRAVTPVP